MRLVQAENVTKRSIARVVSFDDDSLRYRAHDRACWATARRDAAAAEGTSAVPQRLLTSLFGAGPAARHRARARADLQRPDHAALRRGDAAVRRRSSTPAGELDATAGPAVPGNLRPRGRAMSAANAGGLDGQHRAGPPPTGGGMRPARSWDAAALPVRPADRAGPAGPDRLGPHAARTGSARAAAATRSSWWPGPGSGCGCPRSHTVAVLGGRHRQRQVVAVQPAGRGRFLAGRRDPAGDQGAARLRLGHGRRRARCWTGWASRRGTATRGPARWARASASLNGLLLLDLPDHDSVLAAGPPR